jgi:excisionase family DNA binding protein
MEKGGTGGVAGVGAEMAVGMAMAQQMVNQPGGVMAQTTKGVAAANGGGTVELMNPAQVAQMLGVAESDVLASLEAGDLKGKKIGTQWRVPKATIDAFLNS